MYYDYLRKMVIIMKNFLLNYFDENIINIVLNAKKYTRILIINSLKTKRNNINIVRNNKIIFNKWNNIYYIQWSSKKDRRSIFNYLYQNKKDLYLKRKYEKIKLHL